MESTEEATQAQDTRPTDDPIALLDFRPGLFSDQNMILETWIAGFYHGQDQYCRGCQRRFSAMFKAMDQKKFRYFYKPTLEALLGLPETETRIASLKSDPDVIMGFSVFTGPSLHWVYVRPEWRKKGIAKRLVPDSIAQFSHLSVVGYWAKPKGWEYNPFLIDQLLGRTYGQNHHQVR